MNSELLSAADLQEKYGPVASTWRYWANIGQGPESFKIGRRRVWRRSVIEEWIREQEQSA